MTDCNPEAVLRALSGPLMDDCIGAVVQSRGYATPAEQAYLDSRPPYVRSRSAAAEKIAVTEVLELAGLHGVEVDLSALTIALEDKELRTRLAAERRQRELEERESRRAVVRKVVADRNRELLAPLEPFRAAATAGWEAMRESAPNLDGVDSFDELGPKAQFRFLCFAAAALGQPYPTGAPQFVKVVTNLDGEYVAQA